MLMSMQTVEPDSEALEPQHRRRRRRRWMTIGAFAVVAAIGLAAVGSSILGAFGGRNSTTPAHEGVTTTQTGTGADLESSRELHNGRVVKLLPGRVTTDERYGIAASFTVPRGWYGYQGGPVFVIGKGLSPSAVGVNFASGGISVDALLYPLARVVRSLETAAGTRVRDVSPVRIGGYSGREYGLVLHRTASLQDVLAVPIKFSDASSPMTAELQPGEPELILLGVGRRTLVIRRGFDQDQERAEVERVLTSFKFPR